MNLRNGALRKKFDALKYTLKKLEVRQGRALRMQGCDWACRPGC